MNAKEEVLVNDTEDEAQKSINNTKKNEKKEIRICGISIWRILAYFVIYSLVGFIIETLYGAARKGVIESRQSCLYGPFCTIYGLGACIMIMLLQRFKKSHNYLFIGGAILGSIIEYLVSFIGEVIFNVKWWDYSELPFNINGRVCIAFAAFWGILAMYLMGSFNPKVDKFLDTIKQKFKNEKIIHTLIILSIIAIFMDIVVTGVALKFFEIRKIVEYNIDVENKEAIVEAYDNIYSNDRLSKFIYKFWDDRKMIRTFPNLKIKNRSGEIVYFNTLVPNVEPYYFKIYER